MVNSDVPHYNNPVSGCIEITCSSSNSVFSSIKWAHDDRSRCANGLQSCSVSTPAANIVKSYSFSPLWTMIITMFQEKSNRYHISEPKISRFFPKTCATSFTWVWSSAAHLASFWHLFRSVMWLILVPFLSLAHFFFLSWFYNYYSGWVLNKTITLLLIAEYRIIIRLAAVHFVSYLSLQKT